MNWIETKIEVIPLTVSSAREELRKALQDFGPESMGVFECDDRVTTTKGPDLPEPVERIQALRMFNAGTKTECVLARDGDRFRGCRVSERSDHEGGARAMAVRHLEGDHAMLCLGQVVSSADHESRLREARCKEYGLPVAASPGQRVRLRYREYVAFDSDGAAHVAATRTIGFEIL